MKIAIDLTALMPDSTGVDRYMKNLVFHLGQIDRENQYRIYINFADINLFKQKLPDNFRLIPRCVQVKAVRLIFQHFWLPLAAHHWKADIVHSPSFFMPLFRGKQRHLLSVHDMTFFSMDHYHHWFRQSIIYKFMIKKSIVRTDLLLVPSESTKCDVLNEFPHYSTDRIKVIPYGVDKEFGLHSREEVLRVIERLGLPSSYLLYVGTIEPRKNLKRLVESYKELLGLNITEDLVLVGKLGWGYKELLAEIRKPLLRNRVHFLGYVKQHDLPRIYAGASVFVYPSLYEGFGFPPLEAMACGVPTITSSNSALGEYYHGAALQIMPESVPALTEAIKLMLDDDSMRTTFFERGLERSSQFSWKKTAEAILECYQSLAYNQRDENIAPMSPRADDSIREEL